MNDSATVAAILVPAPAAGEAAEVAPFPGEAYALDFDPSATLMERMDEDLLFSFENGGSLRLRRFFPTCSKGDFYLIMPDGERISASDLALALLAPLEDHTVGGM